MNYDNNIISTNETTINYKEYICDKNNKVNNNKYYDNTRDKNNEEKKYINTNNSKNNIITNIFNNFKTPNIIYVSKKHTEQSRRDKILHLINKETNIDNLKQDIKNVLSLNNAVYKISAIAFNWYACKNEKINSFHIVFGYSTFYNETGYEKINKRQIYSTATKRLYNKPFYTEVIIDYNTPITYKIVYNWLKENYKYYKH